MALAIEGTTQIKLSLNGSKIWTHSELNLKYKTAE
jgi:hypothetical protein